MSEVAISVGHLTPEQQADIREHVAGLSDSDKEFNEIPPDGWHCFHCGAHLKTPRGARLHFGATPESLPACMIEASRYRALEAEVLRLREQLNTPELDRLAEGVVAEAQHQRHRWGTTDDAGKTPFDWFWLIGYLAQKAASAAVAGDGDKAKHHVISTAAALANWHAFLTGEHSAMRPGIAEPAEASQ